MARETTPFGRRLFRVLTVAAIGETAWMVFLGWRLPPTYVATHWDAAWLGLDAAEVLSLLACAWAAWRRRAVIVIYATITATLFLLDAWFDVTTARRGDLDVSVITLAIEVPSALALLWVARRAMRNTAGRRETSLHAIVIPLPGSSEGETPGRAGTP